MKQFDGIIKTDKETLLFSFSRVYATTGEKYFVSTYKSKRFYPFDMKKDESGKWRVPEFAPKWLKSIEQELSNLINQNQRT